ncbi:MULTISPECIES: hypothetical protein [unclassified Methylomonas]|uniref:hypothetical protein n=1 Tax=unclassified Methylomonas TaxID=2608980 RepID=UPI00047C8DA8|nr:MULTISPECIES: hypothetical protein [unclassified Methylomonas]QSB03435.1 hypothetical protein JWZ98_11160 [Methylomonas sp. EFPC1]
MSDPNDTAVAQALGQLTGELRVMHQSLMVQIEVIRKDLHRIEDASKEQMNAMESRLMKHIDTMGGRVAALEAEDKRQAVDIAKSGAVGGAISGLITAAAIELIKRQIHW